MRGLTLLEVLISMVVLSIILAVVYGVYISNVEAVNLARRQAQVYQTARIALDRMSGDLESSFIGVDGESEAITAGMIGENEELDGRPADRINFTALTHLFLTEHGPRTDLCEIGFALAEDEESETLYLQRREDFLPDEDIKEGGAIHELAWHVGGLDILYRDEKGEIFNEWNTFEGDHKGRLPSLITLNLTIKDAEDSEQTFELNIRPGLSERLNQQ